MRTLQCGAKMWILWVWSKAFAKKEAFEFIAAFVGVVAVVPAVVLFIIERPDRIQAAVQNSWEVVSRMEGKSAGGGRLGALAHLKSSGEPLAGLVLRQAVIADLDLSNLNLSLSDLQNVRLAGCSFANSVLADASLAGGRFERRCDFSGATLSGAHLERARFVDNVFRGTHLLGSSGDALTSFNGAQLQGMTVSNTELPDANFDNAHFGEARLIQSGLEGASFHRATLDGVHMSGVRANGAQFQRALGTAPTFNSDSLLDNANFDGSQFVRATFESVSLRCVSAFGVRWPQAAFRHCDLTGADFASADLTGATVCDCVGATEAFARARVRPAAESSICAE